MKKPKETRTITITSCEECPSRKDGESHGPCDSDYWTECGITGKEINAFVKFPRSCPIKKNNWQAN